MATLSNVAFKVAKKNLECKRETSEELFAKVITGLAETLASGSSSDGLGEDCTDLSVYVKSQHAYGKIKEHPSESAFALGVFWGAINLVETFMSLRGGRDNELKRREMVEKHHTLLKIIRKHPGVSHGDLADKSGYKKARLSQIMAELRPYHLVVVSVLGRTKHYYLGEEADKMLSSVSFDLNIFSSIEPAQPSKAYTKIKSLYLYEQGSIGKNARVQRFTEISFDENEIDSCTFRAKRPHSSLQENGWLYRNDLMSLMAENAMKRSRQQEKTMVLMER